MKYLKKYNESLTSEDINTLNDICLELSDMGFNGIYSNHVKVHCGLLSGNTNIMRGGVVEQHKGYIYINRKEDFKFGEISDCVYRIKDFLGDNLIEFSYLIGHVMPGKPDPVVFISPEELEKESIDENLDLSMVQIEIRI